MSHPVAKLKRALIASAECPSASCRNDEERLPGDRGRGVTIEGLEILAEKSEKPDSGGLRFRSPRFSGGRFPNPEVSAELEVMGPDASAVVSYLEADVVARRRMCQMLGGDF